MGNYKEITSIDQWKEVLEQSHHRSVVVLKHSTTCPVSANAYKEFNAMEKQIERYLVKVIENRPVSNEISNDLEIQHESPQAFVISNGEVVWNGSHWKITKKEMEKVTENL